MAQATDPVCGMRVDTETAVAKTTAEGREFYFCSSDCMTQFQASPEKYRDRTVPVAGTQDTLETHEPNFTKKGGMTSPKFGSAGSGGLEYERMPESHDKR
jgi:P-type Cu+ transporter